MNSKSNNEKPEPRYSVSSVAYAIASLGYPDGPDSSPDKRKIRDLVEDGEFATWMRELIEISSDFESPNYRPDSIEASEAAKADADIEWRATKTLETLTTRQQESLMSQVQAEFPEEIRYEVGQIMPISGNDEDDEEGVGAEHEEMDKRIPPVKHPQQVTTEDPKPYAGARLRDVLDPWEDMLFRCAHCGREALGKDLDAGDLHDTFFTRSCPACGENVVLIELPHVTEMMANLENLSLETRDEVIAFAKRCAQWEKEKIHCIEQLPEIDTDHIVLIWDADYEGHEKSELYARIVIRCGEREIYRGPSSWEYYDYFIDACKVLRQKYGNRLHDVIPTERTLNALWGDKLNAPEIVKGMRECIRKASRIGNWTKLPIDPKYSWENYRA